MNYDTTYTHGLSRRCQCHGQCHAGSPCRPAIAGHVPAHPGYGWEGLVGTGAWLGLCNPSALVCRCQSLCLLECPDETCELHLLFPLDMTKENTYQQIKFIFFSILWPRDKWDFILKVSVLVSYAITKWIPLYLQLLMLYLSNIRVRKYCKNKSTNCDTFSPTINSLT